MNYNLEYEKAILTAVKRDSAVFDEADIVAEDFYDNRNKKIWIIVKELLGSGKEVNDLTIHEHGIEASYIASLESPRAANWRWCAGKVKAMSLRRQYERLNMHLAEKLKGGSAILEINEWLESEITKNDIKKPQKTWKEELIDEIGEIEKRYMSGGGLAGLPSGFVSLDNKTSGFREGQLIVIGARTGVGKTSLALTIAAQLAIREKTPIGYFTLEMSVGEIVDRLLAQEARIDLMRIAEGNLTRSDFEGIISHVPEIAAAPFIFEENQALKISELKSHARRMVRHGVKMIFIDYLTLIRHPNERMPRHERVGEIAKELKWLAMELKVPVMVMSQLSREAEGKVPSLEYIRQSGEVEEDSDLIILIERKREESDTTLHIAKQRNGPTGKVELSFLRAYARFVEE